MNHDEIMDVDALDPAGFRQVLSHYPTGVCGNRLVHIGISTA